MTALLEAESKCWVIVLIVVERDGSLVLVSQHQRRYRVRSAAN
jgi:hypothetical protein